MLRRAVLLPLSVVLAGAQAAAAAPPKAPAKTPPSGAAAPRAGGEVPPVYVMALPAAVTLVAWLPVAGAAGDVVLDLRVEAVLPGNCGDRLAGLLRRAPDRDAFDVIVERKPVGECTRDPARIGARHALRVHVPDGAAAELEIGGRLARVARAGDRVTLDGEGPAGDAPGAPPTDRPSTLVLGELTDAKLVSTHRLAADPDTAAVELRVSARFPACVQAPLGFLARGDARSRFALTRFQPLGRAWQDQACTGAATRTGTAATSVRIPAGADKVEITVGDRPLSLALGPRPALPPPRTSVSPAASTSGTPPPSPPAPPSKATPAPAAGEAR